jgi:hypothetical protein
MIKVSREWATPLTIGVFTLMAATGLLMFFHLNSPIQEAVHEWAGWLLVAAVVAHATANWLGFKRYFTLPGKGAVIVSLCVLVLAGSFVLAPGNQGGLPPPAVAMRAISQAPLKSVAALFGKTGEQALAAVAAAGIKLPSDDATLASVIGNDREKLGEALTAISQAK